MKTVRFIAAAAVILMAASCGPDADKMAQEYKELATELAKAKLDGDERKVEKIKKEMAELNEEIAEAAGKEAKKTAKKVGKEADKAAKDVEKEIGKMFN